MTSYDHMCPDRSAHRRRWALRLSLAGAASALGVLVAGTAATPAAAVPPPETASNVRQLAGPSLRGTRTDALIYNAMTDRFANGDPSNDDQPSDEAKNEFDPTHKGFYHGGDLRGLIDHLDYLKNLGQNAIWITPPMYNDWLFGAEPFITASYHGYWITGFDKVDPHVGTGADLRELVDEAHERGMQVYFDIVTNHTGDVVAYEEGEGLPYISKAEHPYRDANGNVFNDRDYQYSDTFPQLDREVSFPYTPTFRRPQDATAKSPGWLNDPLMYHNRGETTFVGENSLYGDFFGLDDLFTERPEVVDGMIEIYKGWIRDYDIDGYRVDTTRHVNMAFWEQFNDAILDYAAANGHPDFYIFGEAAVGDPVELSAYTREGKYPAVLDFTFQETAREYISEGGSAEEMAEFFQTDDMFIDHDTNAYQLPTFVDNHDRGRIGWFVLSDNPGISEDDALRRVQLAHDLLYFWRGSPVVYYGDEQGFTGDGNDQDARESMFASQVPTYLDNNLLGTDRTHAQDNFNQRHPNYRYIRRLARIVTEHPALRDGAQIHRYADEGPGVYAFSRMDRDDQVEYVVAINNSDEEKTVRVPTYSARMAFEQLYPPRNRTLETGRASRLRITVPAYSAAVYQAAERLERKRGRPAQMFLNENDGGFINGRPFINANVLSDDFHEVTFAARINGRGRWIDLGTDDNPSYKVLFDTKGLEEGTRVQFRAAAIDSSGRTSLSQIVTLVVNRDADAPNVFEQP